MEEPPEPPAAVPQTIPERGTRLDSWKEIAAYLNRDLRTLQRWEKTANLPIRRLNKPGTRAVFAYTGDLDEWLRQQGPAPASSSPEDRPVAMAAPAPARAPARRRPASAVAAAGTLLALAAVVTFLGTRRGPAWPVDLGYRGENKPCRR